MATSDALIRRLRRLVDDVGHGYSQSAPGFATTLEGLGLPNLSFGIQMDNDLTPVEVTLSTGALSTGLSIAHAIQVAVRAANPGLLLVPPDSRGEYSNFSCLFDPREGYMLRSGGIGSKSMVAITPPTSGNDLTTHLKLGLHNGGYESPAKTDFSDEELVEMLQESLELQNSSGNPTSWTFDTLPDDYSTVVIYRTWGNLLDVFMGRSAWWHPQKVASEEISPNTVFENLFKLSRWLKDKLDDLLEELDSKIEVHNAIVFDRVYQEYVGDLAYRDYKNQPRILAVLQGETDSDVVLEFDEVLTLDAKYVYLAMREGASGVWDKTKLTEETFVNPVTGTVAALGDNSTLVRTLKSMKNTFIKITDLTPGSTYYFALQVVDQNGNRYFSDEYGYTLPTP